MKWIVIGALAILCSACENAIAPSGAGQRKVTKMAADNYDPNAGTDISNGNQDWWNQNAPPVNPATPSPNQQIMTTSGDLHPGDPGWDAWWGNHGVDPSLVTPPPAPPPPTPGPTAGPDFGGPVAPFSGSPYPTFTPPPLPDYLQKGFQLPSAADLQNTPGYMARYQQGLDSRQRSAAANGTILNGGTQKALDKYGQDYASNEYSNLAQQKLSERQQQSSDYLNLAYGPAWQTNQAAVNQYGTLYNQYRNLIGDNRSAQNDYWSHQIDLLNAGLKAAGSGNPGSTGGQA